MGSIFGAVLMIGWFALSVAQVVAGYAGIEEHFSAGWAIGAIVLAVLLRFTLPLTIGSFFGAMNVWGWHWAAALVFALPGLLFMVPGILAALISVVRGRREA